LSFGFRNYFYFYSSRININYANDGGCINNYREKITGVQSKPGANQHQLALGQSDKVQF
jgi:hypothetical protein